MREELEKSVSRIGLGLHKTPIPQDPDKRREMALALTNAAATLSKRKLADFPTAHLAEAVEMYAFFTEVLDGVAGLQKASDNMGIPRTS